MIKKIYVFGNTDHDLDNKAIRVLEKLKKDFPEIAFIEIEPNRDLPFDDMETTYILDTVDGLDSVELIEDNDLDNIVNVKSSSVHDFDLGFQIKYLKKLGKLGSVKIIGIPLNKPIDYLRIQFILRKLVAQDMQGS